MALADENDVAAFNIMPRLNRRADTRGGVRERQSAPYLRAACAVARREPRREVDNFAERKRNGRREVRAAGRRGDSRRRVGNAAYRQSVSRGQRQRISQTPGVPEANHRVVVCKCQNIIPRVAVDYRVLADKMGNPRRAYYAQKPQILGISAPGNPQSHHGVIGAKVGVGFKCYRKRPFYRCHHGKTDEVQRHREIHIGRQAGAAAENDAFRADINHVAVRFITRGQLRQMHRRANHRARRRQRRQS